MIETLLRYPTPHITTTELHVLLQAYRCPAAAIARLEKRGILQRLRRGLYWIRGHSEPSMAWMCVLANWIKAPSYVSVEAALALAGWIPEAVASITSVAPSRFQEVENAQGRFAYFQMSLNRGATGIEFVRFHGTAFRAALPERALIDLLDRERLKPVAAGEWESLLFEFLRIEEGMLRAASPVLFHDLAKRLHPRSSARAFWKWWQDWRESK